MDRRVFITTFMAAIAYSHVASSGVISGSSLLLQPKTLPLKPGDIILAKSHMHLSLPENPKHGDYVQIIVDNTSLKQPCIIDFHSVAIAGDKEPLILNSMANFKLVFNARSNNWTLA